MKVKTCPAVIKAAGPTDGAEEGIIEAIVATYSVDSVGDRIVPGAFKKTLSDWKAAGDPIPVLWSHKSDDPEYHIGHVLEAEERPEGLWVKAQLDIDDPRSKSAKVYRLLKGRRVRNFSFAYDEIDARPAEKSDDGAKKELHELKVYEVGPCLIGANQQTSLLGVKHDEPRPVEVHTHVEIDGKPLQMPAKSVTNLEEAQRAAEAFLAALKNSGPVVPAAPPTVSDVISSLKAGGVLSKEHVPALESLLADLAAGMGSLADVLDVLVGPEADEKATPARPADSSATQAKEQPARPGTASVRTSDDLFAVLVDDFEADIY